MKSVQIKDKHMRNYNVIDLAKFVCSFMVIMIHVKPYWQTSGNVWVLIVKEIWFFPELVDLI